MREALRTGPARTVENLFADLRSLGRGELLAEHRERNLQGTRLSIDRAHGNGIRNLYRLHDEFFVTSMDGVYDSPRTEIVPGEGLLEIHIRLSGVLEMTLSDSDDPLVLTGPQLLIRYQPPGVDIVERVRPNLREACVTLYCSPRFLRTLGGSDALASWSVLEEIHSARSAAVFHRQTQISTTLLYIARSILENPYSSSLRLLYVEAKASELLCHLISESQLGSFSHGYSSESDSRLHIARQMLASKLRDPPRIVEVARAVGMSGSTFKRAFKARFGMTVFDYRLECRMRHALGLLRAKRVSVGEAAYEVGYRHQTSFSAAFRQFFGFVPRDARNKMH